MASASSHGTTRFAAALAVARRTNTSNPAAAMGSATAASFESTAPRNRKESKEPAKEAKERPRRSIQYTAPSENKAARRSNRAEIHTTASWFDAWSANSSAATGPAIERGDSS